MTYVYGVDLGKNMKYTGIDRQPVSYDQISPYMLLAIVAIEDNRFWDHGALDVKGTLRALVNDLEHKPIQGGSTLEQQYVKNVLILQPSTTRPRRRRRRPTPCRARSTSCAWPSRSRTPCPSRTSSPGT